MEKRMINDVYTIEGIDSTSQLVAFYKEVVDKNIEKYVGITTQGIKFKLDNTGERAVQLKPNEEYGLNPMYRKTEVEPIEEIMEELDQPEVVVEPIEEVIAAEEQVDKPIVNEVEAPAEKVIDEVESVVNAVATNKATNEEFEQLQIENAQLSEKCSDLVKDRNLCKERAEAAELREEQLKQRNSELTSIVAEKDTAILELTEQINAQKEQVCEVTLTLDQALDYIKTLGYEAFIRKI